MILQAPAGNNTGSKQPWPDGTFDYGYHVSHPESGPNGPYGSHGNFVFDVDGKSGMGVHSGRQGPESVTNGCIRTTDQMTGTMLHVNENDPLTHIVVR